MYEREVASHTCVLGGSSTTCKELQNLGKRRIWEQQWVVQLLLFAMSLLYCFLKNKSSAHLKDTATPSILLFLSALISTHTTSLFSFPKLLVDSRRISQRATSFWVLLLNVKGGGLYHSTHLSFPSPFPTSFSRVIKRRLRGLYLAHQDMAPRSLHNEIIAPHAVPSCSDKKLARVLRTRFQKSQKRD